MRILKTMMELFVIAELVFLSEASDIVESPCVLVLASILLHLQDLDGLTRHCKISLLAKHAMLHRELLYNIKEWSGKDTYRNALYN